MMLWLAWCAVAAISAVASVTAVVAVAAVSFTSAVVLVANRTVFMVDIGAIFFRIQEAISFYLYSFDFRNMGILCNRGVCLVKMTDDYID